MAYSKFTIDKLIERFNIKIIDSESFLSTKPVAVSDWLKKSMDLAFDSPLLSEKARSELIVSPILQEIRTLNNKQVSIFSGFNLDVDLKQELNGECDFILVKGNTKFLVETPILGIVEAKKQDLDLGIPQVIAQLIGAINFKNNNIKEVFGAVTTGEIWQFLKLDKDYNVFIDKKKYYINNIEEILGVLQFIVNSY